MTFARTFLLLAFLLGAFDVSLWHSEKTAREVRQTFHRCIALNFYFHRARFLPRRSCGSERLARLREFLACQRSEGQALAEGGRARFKEAFCVGHLAVVKTVGLFVEVPEQMERFDRHVGAFQGTLQETPEVLHAVGVDLPIHVCFSVIDHVVNVIGFESIIREQFVGVDLRAFPHVRANGCLQRALADIGHDREPHGAVSVLAVALQQSLHGHFANAAGSSNHTVALVFVHVARFPTDVGFINLDVSADFLETLGMDSQAEPVQHEPRGLLSNAQIARNFVTADAVLAVDEHPQRREPLIKSDGTILEDAADFDRELLFTASALPERTSAQAVGRIRASSAARTFNAIRPSQGGDEGHAGFDVGEVFDGSEQGVWNGGLGIHAQRIAGLSW